MMWSAKQKDLLKKLGIKYPIVQAGMVWVSGGKLAAASANAGILGVVGAGSMKPDLLRHHIRKARSLTQAPFAVNVPLLYSKVEEQFEVALEEGVKIFITSAGSPKTWTQKLKKEGCQVLHVVSSPYLAKKCEEAGVDMVIAEGFEAGGHNGRDEITTMVLIPQVLDAVSLPVICAGGIVSGRQIAAAFALGASGVQMGTRFLATKESSAHKNFKTLVVEAEHDSTMLCMKGVVPVRLIKNSFYETVQAYEARGATQEEFQKLGKGKAKAGMLDGDIETGELEVGQGCSLIKNLPSVEDVVRDLCKEYKNTLAEWTGGR